MARETISVLAPLAFKKTLEPISIFEPGGATRMLLNLTVAFSPIHLATG